MKKAVWLSIGIGCLVWFLSFGILLILDASEPLWASLVIGFLLFEICFYYLFNKQKKNSKPSH